MQNRLADIVSDTHLHNNIILYVIGFEIRGELCSFVDFAVLLVKSNVPNLVPECLFSVLSAKFDFCSKLPVSLIVSHIHNVLCQSFQQSSCLCLYMYICWIVKSFLVSRHEV